MAKAAKGRGRGNLPWRIVKTTVAQWLAHRSPRLGAALAYYSVFSMGPLLLLVIAVAGLFFGEDAVRGRLSGEFASLLGPDGSATVQALLAGAALKSADRWLAALGIVLVLASSIGMVAQLKDALNTIWNVEDPKSANFLWYLRTYLISAAGVLGLGLLLTVSLVFSATLHALAAWASPNDQLLWNVVDSILSFALLTLLFALVFKWFPDTKVEWREVWLGALFTAALFDFGKFAIGWYVTSRSVATTYGAATSVIVLLIWVYYSAQILLLGAELTHAYSVEAAGRRRPAQSKAPHEADIEAAEAP